MACEVDRQRSIGFNEEECDWYPHELCENQSESDHENQDDDNDEDDYCRPSYHHAEGTWQRALECSDWGFFGVDIDCVLRSSLIHGGTALRGFRSWDHLFGMWQREKGGFPGIEMFLQSRGKLPDTPFNNIPAMVTQQILDNRKIIVVKTALSSSLVLNVSLCGLSDPVVSRCIRVPGALPLSALHDKLLCPAFGFTRGYHHYQFLLPPSRYPDGKLPLDAHCDICFAPTGRGTVMDMGREDGFNKSARGDVKKINDSDVAVGDLVHQIGDGFQYILGKLYGWKLDITLVSICTEPEPTDILGGTGAPPPELIQFECDEGNMVAGVEAYAIFIYLFNNATSKNEKNEVLDKYGFRRMTGFHRSGLTADFQPEVFSDGDMKRAKKELQKALRHTQTTALEHQDPRLGIGMLGSMFGSMENIIADTCRQEGVCGSCRKQAVKVGHALLKCKRCKNQFYCSQECQKQHWKKHKKVCVPHTKKDSKKPRVANKE